MEICGEHTAQKQEIFSKFVEHHINIVRQIYDRKGQWHEYLYFDVFAGPGYITNCEHYDGPGSPLIFNNLMSLEDFQYKMIVAESDLIYSSQLKDILTVENAPFEFRGDARDCCPNVIKEWHFGMAYIDLPMTKESFSMLERIITDFAKYCPQVDIVIYISANFVKRLSGMNHIPFNKRLTEFMGCADKDWVIREPIGKLQYTFLVGTKIDKGLTWALWSNEGFYKVDSSQGQKILLRLNYREHEQPFNTYGTTQERMF